MNNKKNALKIFAFISILTVSSGCDFTSGSTSTDDISPSTNSGNDDSSTTFSYEGTDTKLEKLTILSVNDVHGKMQRNDKGLYGVSNVAERFRSIRNENEYDDVITISNGDHFQGQALSNLSHGRSMINAMNAMEFDAMGLGNHEFDWGIEKITKYFDGNQENGEANFPLVNCNVIETESSELLENTVSYQIIQKENLVVGIIGAIGQDQRSSILAPLVAPYTFSAPIVAAGNTAEILRNMGCDIVIATVHDGSTDSSNVNTTINSGLANLTGKKRIDAIINGHTHYYYSGSIYRSSGPNVPVVQAGSSNSNIGRIDLTINPDTKEVTGGQAQYLYMGYYSSFDPYVEAIVNTEYDAVKTEIEEVFGVAGETVTNTNALAPWAGKVMLNATRVDVAFGNYAGLRDVNLVANKNITVADIYEIVPFDNEIFIVDIVGSKINTFISSYGSSNYYAKKDGLPSSLNATTVYKVAVIDYLYYKNYFPTGTNDFNTKLIYRDMLGIDIKCWHAKGEKFYPVSNPNSCLPKQDY